MKIIQIEERNKKIEEQSKNLQKSNKKLEEQDKKFMNIQAIIEEKRNMLINKQEKLAKVAKHNQFLDTVKSDYLKYYNYITQQKREQIQAMELLNTYIKDLSETGELTKQNMEDAKTEQEKIMNEFSFSPKLFEGISKEQQQTLANYAQITAGGVIKIEGQDFNKLDNSQMQKILSNIQGSGSELKYKDEKGGKTATESNIDSIQRNLSATENVILANNQLTNAFSMATLKAGNFSNSLEGYTGVISAALASVKTVLDKSVEGGTKIFDDLKTSFSPGEKETFLDRINEYTTAVSKDRFIKVEGNPTIDVKVTGLDAGVSDVVKTYIANELAKSIKVTASDSSGYSVGAPG